MSSRKWNRWTIFWGFVVVFYRLTIGQVVRLLKGYCLKHKVLVISIILIVILYLIR